MKDLRAELIRVDTTGQAHPIGAVASKRMRAREGAFRILPSPPHTIFMRFTGEDGRRDIGDGRVVRLAGEITAGGVVCDILALIGQAGWRGELIVSDSDYNRSVFFEQGNIVGVETNAEDERLGRVLYRFGAINEEQLAEVIVFMGQGKRFGEAASEVGALSHGELYRYIGKQVEEVVFASLAVEDGTFFFLDGFDESRLVSRHTVSANALLMDLVTRLDEVRYFERMIPSIDHVPVRLNQQAAPPEEFVATYDAVDGKRSVEEIGRLTGKGEFDTSKALYALVQSKHVSIQLPSVRDGAEALVEHANLALRTIHDFADRGGKGRALRDSLASFAVGAGVYDILFRGAGPDETGMLDSERVEENSVLVAQGGDVENMLKHMLHEYVSFALFSAGTALGSDREGQLKQEVLQILSRLRPSG